MQNKLASEQKLRTECSIINNFNLIFLHFSEDTQPNEKNHGSRLTSEANIF